MTWTATDGKLLKDLRTASGLDQATLARRCTISADQLIELEDGGTGRFYSESIKAHTGRMLLARLGHVKQAVAPQPYEPIAAPTARPDGPMRSIAWQVDATPAGSWSRSWPCIAGLGAVVTVAGAAVWIRGTAAPALTAPAWAAMPAQVAPVEVRTGILQPSAPTPHVQRKDQVELRAAPRSADVAEASGVCALPSTQPLVAFTPSSPPKAGDYVYLEASEAVEVCVTDGSQRRTAKTVTPAAGVTLSGTPPITVHTPRWAALRVYFQGMRVPLNDPGLQEGGLRLEPAS